MQLLLACIILQHLFAILGFDKTRIYLQYKNKNCYNWLRKLVQLTPEKLYITVWKSISSNIRAMCQFSIWNLLIVAFVFVFHMTF